MKELKNIGKIGIDIKEFKYENPYLDIISPRTLEEIKERGFEITDIMDGFKVYLRKIGGEIEEEGFGEDIDEAIYNALPIDIKGLDIKEVRA